MRDILFKAKRKDNGEWVEGTLVQTTAVSVKSFIVESACYTFDKWDWLNLVEVDNETICQYTGMDDKNGNRIWENDIVSAWSQGSHAIGYVKQRNDGLWLMFPAYQHREMWGLCPNVKNETTVEIIGNKFDNPELLEVEE